MIWNKLNVVVLIGALGLHVACSNEDTQPNQDTQPGQEVEEFKTDPSKIYPTELPAGADIANCGGQPEAPLLCDWVGGIDAVVWGRLVEVRMAPFPAALADGSQQIVNECSGPVNGALELVLDVQEIYHGTPPETLTIRVGHHQLDEWSPIPTLSPQGDELWWIGDGPKLKPGDHIGAAVHNSPSGDMWGVMGQVLFADGPDGRLVTQERAFCQEPAPVGLAGLTRAELGDAILACPTQLSAAAVERARKRDAGWAQSRSSYTFAGMCFQGGEFTSD